MRVLIIGGTRFIGWHIASALIRAGHSVCVFHRRSTPLTGLNGASEILGQKENLSSYRDRFCDFHPEVVIDCIGYTEADGQRLIQTFAGWIPRLIFLSSCDVYRAHAVLHRATDDPVQATPLTEDSPLRTNIYPYRNYASGLSEAQWVEHIAGIAGWTGKIAIVPDDQLPDPLKVPFNAAQNWTVDASRFRSEMGFTEPFTVKESLEETITWLRSNPPSVPAERLERWEQEDGAEDQWLART